MVNSSETPHIYFCQNRSSIVEVMTKHWCVFMAHKRTWRCQITTRRWHALAPVACRPTSLPAPWPQPGSLYMPTNHHHHHHHRHRGRQILSSGPRSSRCQSPSSRQSSSYLSSSAYKWNSAVQVNVTVKQIFTRRQKSKVESEALACGWLDVIGRREKVRFKAVLKSDKTVRWADVQRERIPIIRRTQEGTARRWQLVDRKHLDGSWMSIKSAK